MDVNIHPTKREVGFLNEEEIFEKICTAVSKRLGEGDSSRRFTVQMLLPGAKPIEASTSATDGAAKRGGVASNYLVRTDPQSRKITSMFSTQPGGGQSQRGQGEQEGEAEEYDIVERERQSIKLASIRELRDEVMEVAHNGTIPPSLENRSSLSRVLTSPPSTFDFFPHALTMIELTELFANHTYVGMVDGWRRLAAIQHGVKLYLVDYGAVWYPLPFLAQNERLHNLSNFILIAVTNSSTN